MSYYRRFVRNFAAVACPLYELTKKNAYFKWTPPCQEALEKLKNLLTSTPILGYPHDSGELILDTDASNVGIGSVLSQMQDGRKESWPIVVDACLQQNKINAPQEENS